MTRRQYDAATAKALLESAYRGCESVDRLPYSAREDGMYVNEGHREVCPPGTVFDWTPSDDINWPGSPNPDTAPFLPIPFTANELAACMLEGVGRGIGDVLEKRIGEPLDKGALDAINPRYRWMRDVLEEAYALAADAQLVVGGFDHDEDARAHALAEQFDEANGQANTREGVFERCITAEEASRRRARAVASVAQLKEQLRQAQASVACKWKAWRKAMVRQLLGQNEEGVSGTVRAPALSQERAITTEVQPMPLKKKALIAALENEWPTIKVDLNEGTRNGLKSAAHAEKHGEWYESNAREWAINRGKMERFATTQTPSHIWPGGITHHRL